MMRCESIWLDQIRRRGDGARKTRVLVACSGGADSVGLLVFLTRVQRSLGLDLLVAHLNHGLRAEALQDADYVRELCRHLDLDLVEGDLDVRQHALETRQGLESAARELRWQWLAAEAQSSGAELVATGHQLDDHTETVLLRLARGGGSGCLTALSARQGLRWSPLIEVRRTAIQEYLKTLGVGWREDASNAEPFTPRNRWRQLLGPLREEAPQLDQHLWETHQQVAEVEAWRETQVAGWRPERWSLGPEGLELRGPWCELELRWVLQKAFEIQGWKGESKSLRDLSAWVTARLQRRRQLPAEWGGWNLSPGPLGWCLHPKDTAPAAQAGYTEPQAGISEDP